jgi:hypothetical protein
MHGTAALTTRFRAGVWLTTGICLFVGITSLAKAQTYAPVPRATLKGKGMPVRASGTFDVRLTPRTSKETDGGDNLVKMSIDKQFHGDLTATSKGEMLADNMGDKGSGGYVAMERVSGTLRGRRGTFVLQHSGTMTRGAPQLTITVVPDSGTDELTGLRGEFRIDNVAGEHRYTFDYEIAPS